ncbi:glycoside hydrolase family 57 protein [Hydrogenimonas thermophila]|uniref:glycoside hydrolase family 57 protein n=1 Tax=Hydrogenimonas thermophila TaxID=223786 RepID=UPI00293741D8|nr:glycoside hydrolase family 57 protein [Hydrogenimonas thermophila]WOE69196.1 glycoside hydrolase family 57 protein [Hydrogenimonas thermophila]WOE71706.1 glycoside hydrolase family 57 protein [Hydrogenimonas thermophila]
MIKLSLFWHMHQPDYRSMSGVMVMPWVFLHSIKDYYDMPYILSNFPSLKATFNLTPTLIEQLLIYEKCGYKCDLFLSLWKKDPFKLSNYERTWVMKICNSPQFETMVEPFFRYAELCGKESLDDSEFIELEVLFMLSWCGNYLRQHNETIKQLIKKGKDFSLEDKDKLLDALMSFIPTILPFYKSLQENGQISLSTTPYYHPILPLLLDKKILVSDAKEQVKRAIELYKEVFGKSPTGIWPAEGAVDKKSVALYKSYGIRWIATDEEILFKSLGNKRRDKLYKCHHFNDLFIAFRDRTLSDLIAFSYRYWTAKEAVDNFILHLRQIDKKEKDPKVSVILDGENSWEFYKKSGYDFLSELYRQLDEADDCQTVTMDELAKEIPVKRLKRLHSGSWIDGNFDTWVAHPQKSRAWELIYKTKEDYRHHIKRVSSNVRSDITDHFLISESSDWFWWYGNEHHNEYAKEFDQLFRNHLIEIYKLMDVTPPSELFFPITELK